MTATRQQDAVVVTRLRKSFGETIVLDGVDLAVGEGTIFALLGPNGAGKTTIVRILSTLISAVIGLTLAGLGFIFTRGDIQARDERASELTELNTWLEERVRERTAAISQATDTPA